MYLSHEHHGDAKYSVCSPPLAISPSFPPLPPLPPHYPQPNAGKPSPPPRRREHRREQVDASAYSHATFGAARIEHDQHATSASVDLCKSLLQDGDTAQQQRRVHCSRHLLAAPACRSVLSVPAENVQVQKQGSSSHAGSTAWFSIALEASQPDAVDEFKLKESKGRVYAVHGRIRQTEDASNEKFYESCLHLCHTKGRIHREACSLRWSSPRHSA